MNRFFNYYNSLCAGVNTYNVFSYDPYIIAIREMLVSELQKIVFYIEKLKDMQIDMTQYTDKVIDFISVLIINLDFRKESIFVIMEDLFNNRKILEKLYKTKCDELCTECILIEPDEDFSSKEKILKSLNAYEKNLENLDSSDINDKKIFREIIINLILNACICLSELKNYKEDFPVVKSRIIKLLNSLNNTNNSENQIIKEIKDFSNFNYNIMKTLYEKNIENYGPVIKTKVLCSVKKGKAILVSGSSYSDLEKILKTAKKHNVNVYTHQDMISAFKYEKFQKYPNLIGNYRVSDNNLFLDFASFPGPIYVSKNAILKTDVIRGQIYTSAKYPAYGIGKIDNDDFSAMIEYALKSDGFKSNEEETYINVGFVNDYTENVLSEIIDKYKTNSINRILIIGLIDEFNLNNDYIKTLFKEANEDDFIISFAYNSDRKNFANLNSSFDFALLYKIIENLISQIDGIEDKIGIFFADCSSSTLSHIFNLINLKIKNIFLGPCCPNVINPMLKKGLYDLFNIKQFNNPLEDINTIA